MGEVRQVSQVRQQQGQISVWLLALLAGSAMRLVRKGQMASGAGHSHFAGTPMVLWGRPAPAMPKQSGSWLGRPGNLSSFLALSFISSRARWQLPLDRPLPALLLHL